MGHRGGISTPMEKYTRQLGKSCGRSAVSQKNEDSLVRVGNCFAKHTLRKRRRNRPGKAAKFAETKAEEKSVARNGN